MLHGYVRADVITFVITLRCRTADEDAGGSPGSEPTTRQAFTAVDDSAAVRSLSAFSSLRSSMDVTRRRHAAETAAANAALERVDAQMIAEDSAARARLKEEAAAGEALQQEVEESTRKRWAFSSS